MAPRSAAKTPKCNFTVGEKVLCIDDIPLIYESHILEISLTEDNKFKYFVHYEGWTADHDDWLPQKLVLKYNKTNLARSTQMRARFLKHMNHIMKNEDLLIKTFGDDPNFLSGLNPAIAADITRKAKAMMEAENAETQNEAAQTTGRNKAAEKKAAVKKTAIKKTAARKVPTKKAPAKKTVPKKTVAKKGGVKNGGIQKRRKNVR